MSNYIDGFVLPIPQAHLENYAQAAGKIAEIWKEHGALEYREYVGDDMTLEGTRSFVDCLDVKEDEAIIFGWLVFESKEARDLANKKVASDSRMNELLAPLIKSSNVIFNAQRMAYAGFKQLV